jgi:glycosyltransferase involved in cell wall biosynthesis
MNPLVSVIIPVYNGERFIKQTINSVMAQSYPELDIIVSNDGSTDGTSAILERYGGRQFRAINEENAGEATAVNRGYKEAKGKYVIVLNADDLLAPNAVTQLVEFMEYHSRIIVAYPDFDVIDAEGKIIEHKRTREYDYTYMVSHHWCFPSVGTIIRREVLEKSGLRNPAYKYVGDFEHFLRIGKHGDFCRIPKTLAYWRRWGAQASSKSGQAMAAEHIRLIADYYENYSLPKSI